jgi:ferritin
MLKPEVQKLLNDQINAEFYSSYLYLSMAAQFEADGFPGIAHWLKVQANEEREHGEKFFNYLLERGAKPVLAAIAAPPKDWASAAAAFKNVVDHERIITGLINAIMAQARKQDDFATENFVQWFVKEQVEEEAQAELLSQRFTAVGENKGALYMLDHQLGKRAAD